VTETVSMTGWRCTKSRPESETVKQQARPRLGRSSKSYMQRGQNINRLHNDFAIGLGLYIVMWYNNVCSTLVIKAIRICRKGIIMIIFIRQNGGYIQ